MPNPSKAEYKHQWYLRNKDKIDAQKRTPEAREKRRLWRTANAARLKEKWKVWSARNPRGEQAKAWRKKNPERSKMHTAKSNESTRQERIEDPRRAMIRAARKRAVRHGFSCDLTPSDLIVPTHCPVLGIPISVGAGKHHHGSPTLDRFDNALGYTKANTRVISYRANWLKSDATGEELMAVARYVVDTGPRNGR